MQTADLFGSIDLTRAGARRRAMEAARVRADQGMDRAARRAEALHAEWCRTALEALRKFAAGQAGMWTIETARGVIEADPEFPRPSDGRAWGRVVQDAVRLGYIVKTKLTAPAASSNASPKSLWKRGAAA